MGPRLRRLGPAPAAGVGRRGGFSSPAGRHGAARERGRRRSAYEAPHGSVAPGPVPSGAESKRRRVPPLPCTAVSGHAPSPRPPTVRHGGRLSARALTPADGVWGHRSSAAPEGREQRTGPQNRWRPSARALMPAGGVWGHRSSAAPEGREQRTGPQNLLTPAKSVVT